MQRTIKYFIFEEEGTDEEEKKEEEEKQEVESYRIMKKKWKDLVAKLAKRKEQAEVEAVAEEEAVVETTRQ